MDNLQRYHEIRNKLSYDDEQNLGNYLIGALSALVDDETWDRAVAIALRCLGSYKTATADPTASEK